MQKKAICYDIGKLLRSGRGIRKMMTHNTNATLFGVKTGTNTVTGGVVMCTVTSR